MKTLCVLVGLLCLSSSSALVAQEVDHGGLVRVEQGILQGAVGADSLVLTFKGVPYAAPPVGALRWRAPQPPLPWQGVRKADQFCANCTQTMVNEYGPWTAEYQPQGQVSEDCLFLNIWTAVRPANEKRPVLVYIPGGAFTGGSGNVPVYDGERLAKRGLVVVTVNYRVGVLGFLAHPELTKESGHHSSGNYGLLDQLAALQWVKRNIAAFGGDPDRVTIMGQSAGAMSVHCLIASPLAKGLFLRAIAQSGSGLPQGPGEKRASAEETGVAFARAKGAMSLMELRAMPVAELTAPLKEEFRFFPIVDGWFLPKSIDEIVAAGEHNDVATLTGLVADEGSYSADYGKASAEEFRNQVRERTGSHAEQVLQLYPASTNTETAASQKALSREASMVSMAMWASKRLSTGKASVYTYLFTHPQPGATQEKYETFHSSELPYIFDNLGRSDRPWSAEDRHIAEIMSGYWMNFIATGNPNGMGLPLWRPFQTGAMETMGLGDGMAMRPIASKEKLEVLQKLWEP